MYLRHLRYIKDLSLRDGLASDSVSYTHLDVYKRQVIALVNIALLRAEAAKAHIPDISQKAGWLRFKLEDFDMERISGLYEMCIRDRASTSER